MSVADVNALIELAIKKGKREDISTACVYDTVATHDYSGRDYEWLWPKYGKVLWIDFNEPAGSNSWKTYDRYYFGRHACLISHDPSQLVQEHVDFYVNPRTKQIDLKFWFQHPDGSVHALAPTQDFYVLEKEYFEKWGLCQSHTLHYEPKEAPGPKYLYM